MGTGGNSPGDDNILGGGNIPWDAISCQLGIATYLGSQHTWGGNIPGDCNIPACKLSAKAIKQKMAAYITRKQTPDATDLWEHNSPAALSIGNRPGDRLGNTGVHTRWTYKLTDARSICENSHFEIVSEICSYMNDRQRRSQ